MRAALLILPLLLGGCSQVTVKDTIHTLSVPTAAAIPAYMFVPIAAPVVFAVTLAAELLIEDGTTEAVKEGQRDLIDILNDEDNTTPLPRRLARLQKTAEDAEGLGERIAAAFDAALFWGALAVALVFGFQLWHYFTGSRVSRKIAADDDDLYTKPR